MDDFRKAITYFSAALVFVLTAVFLSNLLTGNLTITIKQINCTTHAQER